MAQFVERLTLDFGSGHEARVVRSSPSPGYVLTRVRLSLSLWSSHFLSVCVSVSLSLK